MLVLEVGEVHLGVDVTPEALGALHKFLGSGSELRLRAEVQSETEEGTVVGWWCTVGTQVVAGKVTGAVDDDGGECGG